MALKADFGGYITEIDTYKALSVAIGEGRRESDRVNYTIAVKQDGKTVAESTGQIQLVGPEETSLDAPVPLCAGPVPTTGPTTRKAT